MNLESVLIKLKKSYDKNIPELNAYRNKVYPDFVLDNRIEKLVAEIPVFTFHSIEPVEFEKQLQFLAINNYKTLKADEFYQMLIGKKPIPEKAVLLTFDDGWASMWTYGYPLLKKYGMYGVCFLIPGIICEEDRDYLNLDDVWEGKISQQELIDRDKTEQPYCTWREIRHMASQGTIDFQSHTMYHSTIFISPQVADFFHPGFDSYAGNHNVPIFQTHGVDNVSRQAELGTPIYTHQPRMGGSLRYLDDEDLREKCVEFVAENGGEDFFSKSNWRKELHQVIENYRSKFGERGSYESQEELEKAIFNDLVESKRLIEEQLGTVVQHLCYPYYVGSQIAVELSEKAGYVCNYWGLLEERRGNNRVGDNPFWVARLSDELIYRLPGEGRKSPLEILGRKFIKNSGRLVAKLV
ncbi:polysaccharide deacetylase family protein [Capilliphycus salinus ALCB114379]|uniref:polysaccharide deacetylase family protein n=1 Tax=Capilliphycus salinus TaxID=2768948 RepID=UPI0039A6EE7F